MKKMLILAGSIAGSVLPVLAEGETGGTGSTTMDTSAATGLAEAAKNGFQTILSTVSPYVTALVLAGLGIWAALVVIRIVKRAFSRAA